MLVELQTIHQQSCLITEIVKADGSFAALVAAHLYLPPPPERYLSYSGLGDLLE